MISTKKLIYKIVQAMESHKLGYDTVVNAESVSAGTTTLYNDRKISDYDTFLIAWVVNSSVRATAMVSRTLLTNMTSIELFYVDSASTQRWADVKYVSDTSVNLTASSNASGTILMLGLR